MGWLSPLITHTTAFRDQGQQCLLGRLIYGTQVLGLGRGWVVSLNIKINDFSSVVLVSCCRSSLFSQSNAWGSLALTITQWILSAINHPRTPYAAWTNSFGGLLMAEILELPDTGTATSRTLLRAVETSLCSGCQSSPPAFTTNLLGCLRSAQVTRGAQRPWEHPSLDLIRLQAAWAAQAGCFGSTWTLSTQRH